MEPKEIVAKNLQKLLDRKGVTQTQMANHLGYPEMTVSNWMKAKTYPRVDKMQEMADYFGVRRSDIEEIKNDVPIMTSSQYAYLPTTISAGIPLNVESITGASQISIPDSIMGKYAGNKDIKIMKINGESMNNIMPDQSLIAVKPIELSNLKDGDIVVYSDDHEYSVKRYYNHGDKILFRPDSRDSRFTDYITTADDILRIHGKVVLYIVELD